MAEIISLTLADLLIDAENPRLPQPNEGQREALRSLAEHLGRKLLVLAKDILENGLNPSDFPFVMPLKDDLKRYVVLEGNRRLAALKALENPEPLSGAVDAGMLQEFRAISKQYQASPIESIQCVSVKNRADAQHWIKLRHTGENEGAGIVRWGSDEATRFGARSGVLDIHSQALDFLEQRGELTPESRRNIPAASIKRVLGTPEIRAKCGLDWRDGKLLLLASPDLVAQALLHIIREFTEGTKRTEDIYTKEKRIQYANALPADVVVKQSAKDGRGVLASSAHSIAKTKKAIRAKPAKQRDVLIPRDCILKVSDGRIAQIEDELRRMSLEDFTNAASVLSRVFLELSVDFYIENATLTTSTQAKLRQKLQDVLNDLVKKTKLTPKQARPLRTSLQRDSFLMPSLDLMNDYVHSTDVFPAPSDLRANWNTLQPFFVAIWSP